MGIKEIKSNIFPTLGIPTIYVAQPYGGIDASQMEAYLTYFYEYHFLYHIQALNTSGPHSPGHVADETGIFISKCVAMWEPVAEVDRSRAAMPPGTLPPFV